VQSNESAAGAGTGLKGHTAVPLNERSNNELLRGALSIEKDTTEQLRQGLAVAKQTEVVGAEVAQKLSEDKEKVREGAARCLCDRLRGCRAFATSGPAHRYIIDCSRDGG
jgi:hypothetical protein